VEAGAEAPVLVSGAGPAGASLALLLASRGIAVTLLERQHDFAREFRGEVMTPGGLDALTQIGIDPETSGIPHARPSELDVIVEGRRVAHIDLDEVFRGGRPAMTVSQPVLLEQLVALAQTHACFRLMRGASLHDLVRDEAGRVCGALVHDDEGQHEIRARLVVGADGRSSVVRKQGGFEARERDTPLDIVWTKMPWPERWRGRLLAQAHVADGHLLLVFPSPEGGMQLAWIIAKGTYGDLRKRGVEEWIRELAQHARGDLGSHLLANAHDHAKPFLLRAVTDRVTGWARPGVLLIGDAAHTMSPVGGQGINVALRDAIVAANHLVPPLRERASSTVIDAAAAAVEPERGTEIELIQQIAARPPRIVLGRSFVPRLVRRLLPFLIKLPPARMAAGRIASIFLYGQTKVRLRV
jgi:2-polyprenyl-6-methoxyphenol hydroxylase-like FAD-dependent oxidoreductase